METNLNLPTDFAEEPKVFGDKLIIVHPLGGCGMSDVPESGVVDDQGRVFAGQPFAG